MSDFEHLLDQFDRGALLRPSSLVPNIVDLANALAAVADSGAPNLTGAAVEMVTQIGECGHLVFVLADGLGMNVVERLGPDTFIASHLAGEIRTAFPSSSPVVLTSLATGTWPSQHAVTGQWTYLPGPDVTASLLRFTIRPGGKSLHSVGVTVDDAFGIPPLMAGSRRNILSLYPLDLVDGVTSAYLSGGRARSSYRSLSDAVDQALAAIDAADSPTYTYVYAARVDIEAHRHGITHQATTSALMELDGELARLAEGIAGRGRLVVSADHGLLDTPVPARHWIRPSTDLYNLLRCPPSGDSRVMYLHVRDGAIAKVRRRFHDRYGERFFVLTIDEAEQAELFGPGPISATARGRLGDLIVLSRGLDVLEYVPSGRHHHLTSILAHHSGLTPEEMRVPLILA